MSAIGNEQRFQGGLAFKAHRLVYYSTLGLSLIKKKIGSTLALKTPRRVQEITFAETRRHVEKVFFKRKMLHSVASYSGACRSTLQSANTRLVPKLGGHV